MGQFETQVLSSQRDMAVDLANELMKKLACFDLVHSDSQLHLARLQAEAFVNECNRYEGMKANQPSSNHENAGVAA